MKDFPTLSISFPSFPSRVFLNSRPHLIHMYIYIYIYIFFFFSSREQCCLFEFPSLVVILKHSRCFINFIHFLMADPSLPFVPVLMTLVFKRESFRNPKTNFFSLSKTLSLFPFLHRLLLLKHFYPFTLIKSLYYNAGEKPKLFLS